MEQTKQVKCMRCGTEILPSAVFCEDCLADMEKHPVAPGTPINLPKREKAHQAKRGKRRITKPEDQMSALRKLVVFLMVFVIVLALALSAAIFLLYQHQEANDGGWLPGQNYGTAANEN